jgi:hypothetical protein
MERSISADVSNLCMEWNRAQLRKVRFKLIALYHFLKSPVRVRVAERGNVQTSRLEPLGQLSSAEPALRGASYGRLASSGTRFLGYLFSCTVLDSAVMRFLDSAISSSTVGVDLRV